jgi:hypothetical protein
MNSEKPKFLAKKCWHYLVAARWILGTHQLRLLRHANLLQNQAFAVWTKDEDILGPHFFQRFFQFPLSDHRFGGVERVERAISFCCFVYTVSELDARPLQPVLFCFFERRPHPIDFLLVWTYHFAL